ncbi:uncharacterized protein LOC117752076 isoform X2 [Hippoglossus hippoglossus]|uniref:uncharacterized protein LOC117752076 isoform X2 n=1 Tax=Hippoglossus hippoglossus TaxID=8267 RepID=UPI00148D1583|nr:uncharacterized protein LOC117752076 isoform X2 [Hippoglossus hippoglossus]
MPRCRARSRHFFSWRQEVRALTTDTMSGFAQRIPRPPQPKGPALGLSKLFGCAIPIAQIAIGAVYLDDCPVQHYIPIYLIVSGVFGLMLALLSCLPFSQKPEDGTTNPLSTACITWNSLTSCFLFCWFIAGELQVAVGGRRMSRHTGKHNRRGAGVGVILHSVVLHLSGFKSHVPHLLQWRCTSWRNHTLQ